MFDYNSLPVNGTRSLKSMLRAIGVPFPEKKWQMVEKLQAYDKEHSDKPAHTLSVPPTRPRKKKGSKTSVSVLAPTVPAQATASSSRPSRKRKESPAVQPEPQTKKRVRTYGKGALEHGGVGSVQDEDAPMLDPDHTASGVDTSGRSQNTRLLAMEEEDEEQFGTHHAAVEDVRKTAEDANEVQIDTENSKAYQAIVGGASATSHAQRKHMRPGKEIGGRFAAFNAQAVPAVRSQHAGGQPASAKPVMSKARPKHGASSTTGEKGRKPVMSGQGEGSTSRQDEAAQHRPKVAPGTTGRPFRDNGLQKKGFERKGKAIAPPDDDSEESLAGSAPEDNNGNALTNTAAPDSNGQEAVRDSTAGPVLTEAQKREKELHEQRELGGYANPEVASHWRQVRKTVLAPIDNFHDPNLPRAKDDELPYCRQLERARENAEKTGQPIPLQDCKSPPRKLDELREYVHYPQ